MARFQFWTQLSHGILSAITFTTMTMILFIAGPMVETKFFPVVGKLSILRTEVVNAEQTKVWAFFTKLRPCNYIGIAWHRKEGMDLIRVPLQLLRDKDDVSSPNRPVGSTKAGPWIVNMPEALVLSDSYVELQHECNPFWTTTTEFYP